MGEYLQVVQEQASGPYLYLQRIQLGELAWYSLDQIDEFEDLRRSDA
jgi:hypothetical protein